MGIQDDLNLLGALLPIIAAGGALIPGVGPTIAAASTAFIVAEDGIKVEQAMMVWLNSPGGAKTRALIDQICARLGLSFDAAAGVIKPETREDVQTDLDSGDL